VGDCQFAIKTEHRRSYFPPINDDFEADASETFAAFRPSMRAMYGADFECFAWLKVKDQIHHYQHHHGNS